MRAICAEIIHRAVPKTRKSQTVGVDNGSEVGEAKHFYACIAIYDIKFDMHDVPSSKVMDLKQGQMMSCNMNNVRSFGMNRRY